MSPHFSWRNFTCLIGQKVKDELPERFEIFKDFKPLGTGFIIFSEKEPYLITARHVVQNECHSLKNLICIFDYIDMPDYHKVREIIDLDKNQADNDFQWAFHERDKLLLDQGNNYLIDLAVTKIK
ncbi:MAG: hypothetical protein GPJ52_03815 [Candidatus Heimdallarchaeota archaeon]|nr:hypothetical protein [Candidatus Heimdallarchaeota archaeon]